jgi:hypothetical protein
MPITATSAKGVVNLMLEASNGEQLLLASTAVIATITGITAPTGSTGMRFHVKISNFTTSGTFTITGTGTPASTETVTVAALTTQQAQSAQLANFEYVSVNAYTAITNITTTGLTNGTITVYGIQAGKFAVPSLLKSQRKPKIYSPNEHNSFIERDKKVIQLVNETTIDEFKQDAYGDLSLWWPYMMLGAPTSTATIPATPTVLKASTVVATSPQSLTTQPSAPGERLVFTVTSTAVAGTIGITGTERYSNATATETITTTGAGTYYSSNVYSAIASNGITYTGMTAGSSAIAGVFGWQLTFLSSANKYTAAIEWYDGVGSWTHPFSFFTEGDFDAKVLTEIAVTAKGVAQDKLPIGDRTTTPLSGTNRITSIGQNLSDLPMVGWQTTVFVDAITGTPLTTAYNDLQELKVMLKIPDEHHYTFTNSTNFNRAYAAKRQCTVDTTINFIDMLQWEQFRQNLKQYLAFQFLGGYLGTDGSTPYFKSWTWTLPIKSDGGFDVVSDPSKAIVTAKATWMTEYDSGIGGAYKLVVATSLPPTYPS